MIMLCNPTYRVRLQRMCISSSMSIIIYGHIMLSNHIPPSPIRSFVRSPGVHSDSPYHTRKPGEGCAGVGEPSARRSNHRRGGRAGVSGSRGIGFPLLSFLGSSSPS